MTSVIITMEVSSLWRKDSRRRSFDFDTSLSSLFGLKMNSQTISLCDEMMGMIIIYY
jgi:hypothetical protein